MTIEEAQIIIEDFENIVMPTQANRLLKLNYEGKGELDKQEYLEDATKILELAKKGLYYEQRLKADMVAMLEDLDLLIDEFDPGCGWDGYIKKIDVHKLIQQKINALKEDP